MSGWLVASWAVAGGFIVAVWGYVKTLAAQVMSRVIVTVDVKIGLTNAASMYFWKNFQRSSFGPRTYLGFFLRIHKLRKVQLVGLESVGSGGRLYWKGWRPIWVTRQAQPTDDGPRVSRHGEVGDGIKIVFLRGMFDADRLVLDITAFHNKTFNSTDDLGHRRHYIKHVSGSDGKPANNGRDYYEEGKEPDRGADRRLAFWNRILGWQEEDLAPPMKYNGSINQLALASDAIAMVTQTKRWLESEDWYHARGLPWHRGWLLYGDPGNGKTSLVRAIAEDFDLPVYVFMLGTLYDDEMRYEWTQMLSATPCIALIEDIDTIFDGRTNKVGHLTFDCLLNCLDGVERNDGVLTIVTTNKLPMLDAALGIPRGNGKISTRPGRIDCVLEMGPPDRAGRFKLAKRILPDHPEEWDRLAILGDSDSGAQMQERCAQRAMELYWLDQGLPESGPELSYFITPSEQA